MGPSIAQSAWKAAAGQQIICTSNWPLKAKSSFQSQSLETNLILPVNQTPSTLSRFLPLTSFLFMMNIDCLQKPI